MTIKCATKNDIPRIILVQRQGATVACIIFDCQRWSTEYSFKLTYLHSSNLLASPESIFKLILILSLNMIHLSLSLSVNSCLIKIVVQPSSISALTWISDHWQNNQETDILRGFQVLIRTWISPFADDRQWHSNNSNKVIVSFICFNHNSCGSSFLCTFIAFSGCGHHVPSHFPNPYLLQSATALPQKPWVWDEMLEI